MADRFHKARRNSNPDTCAVCAGIWPCDGSIIQTLEARIAELEREGWLRERETSPIVKAAMGISLAELGEDAVRIKLIYSGEATDE